MHPQCVDDLLLRKLLPNLLGSLARLLSRQAQHGPDRLCKLRARSSEDRLARPGFDRGVRLVTRIGDPDPQEPAGR